MDRVNELTTELKLELSTTKDVSTEFFHSPEEEKLKVRVQTPQFGEWSHPKHLTAAANPHTQKGSVEYLYNIYYPEQQVSLDRVPLQSASFKSTSLEYTKEVRFLAAKLLGVLSETLGLEAEAMQNVLSAGSFSRFLRCSMRTNFYGLNGDGEALLGIWHAHSDPGSLTVLLAYDAPGLQVIRDGRWVKVDPIPGGLIINIGDMLEICSNGRYKSVEHRGLPSRKQERISLATFQAPRMDAVIGPIRSLLDESHPPLYKTLTFGAYFGAFAKVELDGKRGL